MDKQFDDCAGHDLVAAHHGLHRCRDRTGLGVVQDVAAGARLERLDHVVVGLERGQEQDLMLGLGN
jgi:hypothetical protein